MNLWNQLTSRFAAFFRKCKLDADMDEEMRSHIEMRTRENIGAGMNPEEARFAALRQFGWTESIKEDCREQRGVTWLENLARDIRCGARQLRKNPGFTTVAVLTLALGIGANTAIFTVLHALVWRPLPVKDPAAAVNLHQSFAGPSSRRAIGGINRLSYPEYLHYRDHSQTLSGLLAFEEANFTLGGVKTSRVPGVLATGNYFSVLGAVTELGRVWNVAECEVPGACPVVVLSHGFWQRRFGGDRDVVGRTVFVNRQPLTVIGVLAKDFHGTDLLVPDVWVPLLMRDQISDEPGRLAARDFSWLQAVGRLKPGASLADARGELGVVALLSDADAAITGWPARKTQVQVKTGAYFNSPEEIRNGLPVVLVVMVIIGLVLVVVCANVSNLLLARASVRRREIGVRLALGAGRARLVRQLMTESLLLSGIAGVVGLALAFSLPRLLFNLLPAEALPALDFTPDLAVLGYCSAISLLAALCVGLAPALHATRFDLASMLSAQGTPPGQRLGGTRLRNGLVITQVAVSLLLLVSAGLLVRGLRRALSTDLGFDRKNVFVLSIDLEASGYKAAQAHVFHANLIERLNGLVGVKATSLVDLAPFMGTMSTIIQLDQAGASGPVRDLPANFNKVSPSYFETLGVGLVRGRNFTPADVQSGAKIAVITEAMANRYWPGEDPLGRSFHVGTAEPYEVVGIIRDISTLVPGVMDGPFFYQPTPSENEAGLELIIRGDASRPLTTKMLQDLVATVDSRVAVSIRTMDENVAQRVTPARLASTLATALGLLALGLVAIGVYGVMAYVVSQRTREIGVRIALGAEAWMIQRQVVAEGLRVVAVGILIGLLLAALGSQVLRLAIFGLGTLDPVTFLGVSLLLLTISVLACWLPARRAANVDPMEALRHE